MNTPNSHDKSKSSHLLSAALIAMLPILAACDMPSTSEAQSKTVTAEEQRKKVKWVIDGDTFKVCDEGDTCKRNEQISIRIKGLECPESRKQACKNKPDADCEDFIPQGKKAKKVAIKTLKNQMVTLQATGSDGKFESGGKGRKLAFVKMPDGSDFGLTMIEKGLCYDYNFRYPHDRHAEYTAAQEKAGVFPIRD